MTIFRGGQFKSLLLRLRKIPNGIFFFYVFEPERGAGINANRCQWQKQGGIYGEK